MKVLLVLPPTAEKPSYAEPPAGLLYVGSALKRAGHAVTVLDIYRHHRSPEELLQLVRDEQYEVLGFGGITTCYGYVKEASLLIRKNLPTVHLIAGGVLSSTYELLLQHTAIDVVCRAEGELTAVNVVNRLAEGRRVFDDIRGVAFLQEGKVVKSLPQPYIENLDDIPIPDYELLDMDEYAFDAMKDPFFSIEPSCRSFYRPGMRVFNLKTARGCTNACTFCYRHFAGYRQHSIEYVIRHIRRLQERYNVHFIRFGDELFTRDKAWILEFTKRLVAESITIKYIIHGVRTDNVDRELMLALKNSGCVTVFIGFESGSQKILNVMRKNVALETNIAAVRTILDSGLNVLVQTVIGMPSEDHKTIAETIDSLIRSGVSPEWLSINYTQAYPGTWLWQHAIKTGMIVNTEQYLIDLGRSNALLLNYTDVPLSETRKWSALIYDSVLKAKNRKATGLFDKIITSDLRLYRFTLSLRRYGMVTTLMNSAGYLYRLIHGRVFRERF